MTTLSLSEQLIRELTSFGLTQNEAKAYLALLQLKRANARAIAKLSNLPRQEIYRVLPRLEKLGIVAVILGKPTRFLAIHPEEVLSELIERQQEVLTRQISELRRKKSMLESELKKVEGKSAGLVQPEPVRFALISGQRQSTKEFRKCCGVRKAKCFGCLQSWKSDEPLSTIEIKCSVNVHKEV